MYNGRLKSGAIIEYWVKSKMNSKSAIKSARKIQLIGLNNDFANKLLVGDYESFWLYWKSKYDCVKSSLLHLK